MRRPPAARAVFFGLAAISTSFAIPLSSLLAGPPPLPGPELRFSAPPGLVSGTTIETSASLLVSDGNVLSWSLCVWHDGLEVRDVTTDGTDFDRFSREGYAESGVFPDGSAYYSIGVLSFVDPVTLPPGAHEVLRASCLITRKDPGPVRVVPRDGLKLPDDDREFTNAALFEGGATVPLQTAEKSFEVAGCAAFVLATEPSAPSRIEARRGSRIEVDVLVRVASAAHLHPTGFSFGVAHDPAVLSLEEGELIASFTEGFVKADGFARAEISDAGFAAAVLSSPSAPSALLPGDHAVARAVYGFHGTGRPGDELTTTVLLSDDLTIGGSAVRSVFQPLDALPCELSRLSLPLVIGPDWWIRGDGNADGKPDLGDAIATLRFLFLGDSASCLRAMEVNRDGRVDLSDPVALLSHLFLGAAPPAPPFPTCGAAEDTLECAVFVCPAV
jgi:hypothetical protein